MQNRKVNINGTLNRQGFIITPTTIDSPCPHFKERFIGWGVRNERRAICESKDPNLACDYKYVTKDGTPLCLRYWYGPRFEITDEIDEPYIQRTDEYGRPLYYDEEGNETHHVTDRAIWVLISEENPVPYLAKYTVQEKDTDDKPLFWDSTVDPEEKTTEISGTDAEGNLIAFEPVLICLKPHFFSKQYMDTHGKIFGHKDNVLGWHLDV